MGNDNGTIQKVKRTTCDIYSRVCGYLVPIISWNPGKTSEWKDRKVFKIKK